MKSYVTLEQRICLACGVNYDTDAILMDRTLTRRFDHRTTTGYGLCPKHTLPGYVTLLEVDPTKSRAANDGRMLAEDAHRTGRMMFIKEEKIHTVFDNVPEGALCLFIDIEAFSRVLEANAEVVTTLKTDDVKEILSEETVLPADR